MKYLLILLSFTAFTLSANAQDTATVRSGMIVLEGKTKADIYNLAKDWTKKKYKENSEVQLAEAKQDMVSVNSQLALQTRTYSNTSANNNRFTYLLEIRIEDYRLTYTIKNIEHKYALSGDAKPIPANVQKQINKEIEEHIEHLVAEIKSIG